MIIGNSSLKQNLIKRARAFPVASQIGKCWRRPKNLGRFFHFQINIRSVGTLSLLLITFGAIFSVILIGMINDLSADTIETIDVAEKSKTTGKKTNIIFFLADDLGYGDVQCYGSKDIKTPVLDSLASEGVRFTDGYAAFPVCSPSRAAIVTGRYPQRFGPAFEDYFGGGSPGLNPEKHMTIAARLKKNGYVTGCFGKWNVSNSGSVAANKFGFDRWVGLHLNHDYYTHRLLSNNELDMYIDGQPTDRYSGIWSDTVFANEAIRFIEDNKDRPFFIYLPWQAPHDPIQDPNAPFDPPKKNLPENRHLLIKMIERLDTETGRVLAALETHGLSENTLVIFTSDNGGAPKIANNGPLRGAKQELYEGGIRVPLLIRWPRVVRPNQIISTPVNSLDLTATIAEVAKLSLTTGPAFDGQSLMPILEGSGKLSDNRPLFFRRRMVNIRQDQFFIRQSALRKGDMKYVRSYKFLGNGKYSDQYIEELFNLKEDVSESKNLINSAPEQIATLRGLFESWEREMGSTSSTP